MSVMLKVCLLMIIHGMIIHGKDVNVFNSDEYNIISSKRVRREIRDLSEIEWNKIVNAMWTMKTVNDSYGKQLYGNKYINYDNLGCIHYMTTFDKNGDLGHFGPHFFIFHRAFVLKFEQSLLAIDPSIESVPYWDLNIDINTYTEFPFNSPIFSDNYFGSYQGNETLDYIVTDGKFKYWPINTDTTSVGCDCTDFKYCSPYGFLREQMNFMRTKYLTRLPKKMCETDAGTGFPELNMWDTCLNSNITDIATFSDCQEPFIHQPPHYSIGGTNKLYPEQETSDGDINNRTCLSFKRPIVINGVSRYSIQYNCYNCTYKYRDRPCNPDTDSPQECGLCYPFSNECIIENEIYNIIGTGEDQYAFGDFMDVGSSPNDPIFFFHHANVDRLLSIWMINNYDLNPHYNYPENGYDNVNLNDYLSLNNPILNIFNDTYPGPYTYKNILELTTILESTYTYDTILDIIQPNNDDFKSKLPLIFGLTFGGIIVVMLLFIGIYWIQIKTKPKNEIKTDKSPLIIE